VSILKTVFGTATVTDMHLLHDLLNDMRLQEADMPHAVDNQLTYVKELGPTTRINANAIAKMSTIMRDNIIQSSEQYQQVTRDMLWLNVTLLGQNTLYTSIRQIELALQQLTNWTDYSKPCSVLFMGSYPSGWSARQTYRAY
jgi:hypothetical protein